MSPGQRCHELWVEGKGRAGDPSVIWHLSAFPGNYCSGGVNVIPQFLLFSYEDQQIFAQSKTAREGPVHYRGNGLMTVPLVNNIKSLLFFFDEESKYQFWFCF